MSNEFKDKINILTEIFVIIDEASDKPMVGAFTSYKDAEQFLNDKVDFIVRDMIKYEDPKEVTGFREWDKEIDYRWLFNDTKSTFKIYPTVLFE